MSSNEISEDKSSKSLYYSSTSLASSTPLVYFPKPSLVIYRFLWVVKTRAELVFEVILFVKRNLLMFLKSHWQQAELAQLVEELRNEANNDNWDNEDAPRIFPDTQNESAIQDSVVMYFLWKSYKASNGLDIGHGTSALKRLIHLVIIDGMISNTFRVNIDPNHVETFKYVKQMGCRQIIFSSSVQKVFENKSCWLSYTDHGDLCQYLEVFDDATLYDTKTKDCYVQMAERFGIPPSCILLVAFSKTECKKAARAGFMVAKVKERDQTRPKYYTIRVVSDINAIRFVEPIEQKLPPPPVVKQASKSSTKKTLTTKKNKNKPPAVNNQRKRISKKLIDPTAATKQKK